MSIDALDQTSRMTHAAPKRDLPLLLTAGGSRSTEPDVNHWEMASGVPATMSTTATSWSWPSENPGCSSRKPASLAPASWLSDDELVYGKWLNGECAVFFYDRKSDTSSRLPVEF